MRLKQAFIIGFLFMGMHAFSQTVFPQIKQEKGGSFSGFIESVASNERCIIVNEGRVFFADAIVVDEKGRALGVNVLKAKVYVTVYGIQRGSGFFATKIVTVGKPNVPRSNITGTKESAEGWERR